MRRVLLTSIIFMALGIVRLVAQEENSTIRSGNKKYKEKKYEEAEVLYKKAIDVNPDSYYASHNLGDALFRQKKYDEAVKEFKILTTKEKDKMRLAGLYYNLGNSYLFASKLDEAIDAYKSALRNNPKDMEAKYNLAYAQQQKKNGGQGKNDQNKDKKDQKDDQKQDQQNKNDQDQDKKDQQQQQQQDQKQDQQKQDQQKAGQDKNKISKEDAQRMLEAMQDDEKKTQEKVREQQKVKARSVRIEKEW